jgi:hypothetical protein
LGLIDVVMVELLDGFDWCRSPFGGSGVVHEVSWQCDR